MEIGSVQGLPGQLPRCVMPRKIDGMSLEVHGEGVTGPVTNGATPGIEGQPARRKKTGGRVKGVPNRLSGQIKRDVADFFRSCTVENVRWRQHFKRMCDDGTIFDKPHFLVAAIAQFAGKPIPKQPPTDTRPPLLFVTAHPIGSYDPLAAKAATLAARKADRSLPETSAEAYTPPAADDPDGLVIVEPEPNTLAQAVRPR
jgi:hypothetical protein